MLRKLHLIMMPILLAIGSVNAQPDSSYVLPVPAEPRSEEELSRVLQVDVERIEVSGVTAIDADTIGNITSNYEGRAVSSAELQELRLALSTIYLDNGFVNSGVILPDQSVTSGVIRYQAIEGELTRIEIEGDPDLSASYIEKRLARLITDPVKIDDIQYALQYLQNDPNIDRLDARLAPGDSLGQSILRLEVDEPTRFETGLGLNNHRATSTGEDAATIFFRSRNLTGYGEVLTLSTGVSDGSTNSALAFNAPITSRNTDLQIYGSESDSSIIEARLQTLDIESLTETIGIRLSHPFIDNLDRNFSISTGFESRHSESTLGDLPFSLSAGAQDGVSETNVVLLGLDWTERDENSVWTARLNFRHGGDYRDSTIFTPQTDFEQLLSANVADGRFDLVQTQFLYLRRIGSENRMQLAFRASGQFSADPLMAIEKIAIGGVNTVRGYPENFLVRDNGLALSTELRIPVPGASESPGFRNLSIVPFLDYGRSWDKANTNNISSSRDTSNANSITSLGVGLVWTPLRNFNAELYWGADVSDDLSPGEDPRDFRDSNTQDNGVHFAVSYSLNW